MTFPKVDLDPVLAVRGRTRGSRRVSIVGSSFYKGASDWIPKLKAGQAVVLKREPDNKYDKNAIAVYIFKQQLGHIPRGLAAEIAPLMDAGATVSAVKAKNFPGSGVLDLSWEVPSD